jgi:hypothetical protein
MDMRSRFRLFQSIVTLTMRIWLLIFLLHPCNAGALEGSPVRLNPGESDNSESIDRSPVTSLTADLPPELSDSAYINIRSHSPIEKVQSTRQGVNWSSVWSQSMFFLAVEQGYRLGTQPGTREALKGKFFDDWFNSVTSTKGWGDGDDFLTNYIGHPMEGSVVANIFVQNDPRGRNQVFGWNSAYWNSRLKATAWSAIYSTQFELGLISEASLGNVGYQGKSQSGAVDLVITPLAGLGWQVGEDLLDKYLIVKIESRTRNPVILMLARSFLNPTRSFANAMRMSVPWARDTRPGIWKRTDNR